jgi:excisionase family DNA binding protein
MTDQTTLEKIRLYTTIEVADMLGVTKYIVRDWIKNGHMEAIKAGRVYRIAQYMIDDFMEINSTKFVD